MRTDNFIAFFAVCGFFIGTMFVILKINEPEEIFIYICLITFFFYLFGHIAIMNFVDITKLSRGYFNKEKHEDVNEFLIGELALREKRLDVVLSRPTKEKVVNKIKKSSRENGQVKAQSV